MQEYNNADQRLHLLSQTIAKVNRTYVPKKEDDSHTNVIYDSLGDRISGKWIDTPNGKVMLSLNIPRLSFEWLDDAFQVIDSVNAVGKTVSQIEEILSYSIEKLGLNKTGFIDPLHFEIPNYVFAQEPVIDIPMPHLAVWKHYRELANDACGWLLRNVQQEGEIRIWPHHFDTGIYVEPNEKIGIGFGLAMEDSMAKAPYLYFSGYSLQGKTIYDSVPPLSTGRWEIGEHWKGAILPITDIAASDNEEIAVTEFLESAVNWLLKA